jgi:uncharacterized protein YjlB
MSVVSAELQPLTFDFVDDGLVPNSKMPFLVYKRAIEVDNGHPEQTIEKLFGANGWGAMWRNGVYDYLHYHSTVHEVLGVARGNAVVRFGGDNGTELAIAAGDVAILPAGTGHQRLSSSAEDLGEGFPPSLRAKRSNPSRGITDGWIASSLTLLAMTAVASFPTPRCCLPGGWLRTGTRYGARFRR